MTENQLNLISTCIIALANLPNGTEQIQNLLKSCILPTDTQETTATRNNPPTKIAKKRRRGRPALDKNTFKLSTKEILSMPNKTQKLFAFDDKLIPYRFHKGVFEAHYRRNGLNIYASAKDFHEMKRRFIEKISTVQPPQVKIPYNQKNTNNPRIRFDVLFVDYVNQWLETKKVTVKASTYAEYERLCEKNLKVAFPDTPITEMTRGIIQEYLFKYIHEGKARTAQKLHLILTCIFDLAVEDLDIKNPMKKIELPYHESKKGSALTKQEERTLVDYCIKNSKATASSALLVLLYFGLRQSELASISVENETLTCTTSKQLKGRVEVTRSIPFTPMLKKVLPHIDFERAKETKQRTIASAMKRLFPKHHPHELRYTFITRCKECGVNPEVVMLWDGHSFDKDVKTTEVDRGYTDYSQEYLRKEALKVDYPI
ncbi:MAG: tyrosine-type recombinase/integrase family protein [Clostridia bacterium]|nr:tyrosine-type recombinase/integrase family protein [Clostridia bacterium]